MAAINGQETATLDEKVMSLPSDVITGGKGTIDLHTYLEP